jgi:hypothetical protein
LESESKSATNGDRRWYFGQHGYAVREELDEYRGSQFDTDSDTDTDFAG